MFQRSGLPVEIVAEFDNWRRIRDAEGSEGWVLHSLLSGRRTALVAPWRKGETHLLRDSASVLDTSFEVGLSGPGRLHDLFVTLEALTPGEARSGGAGIDIRWGIHYTPFGRAVIGITGRGVCALHFVDSKTEAVERLQERLHLHARAARHSLQMQRVECL